MGFTQEQISTIWTVNCVLSSFSLAGSAFICSMYMIFPSLRGYTYRLIFYLALSDLFISTLFIMPDEMFGSYCWVKGVLINYTGLWNIFITGVISLSIYKLFWRYSNIDKERAVYCIINNYTCACFKWTTFNY